MKMTIAILGLFVALFCSPQSTNAAAKDCSIQAIYQKSEYFCKTLPFIDLNFCAGFATSISNKNFEAFIEKQEEIFCSIPFLGTICDFCDFASIFSDNQNITIATGNSTAGSTRILGLPTLIPGGPI
ncbi:hypothetical protein KR084_005588 [Drosophila pseudotakahashii]|nr:hypothetical protein KR084_005588 [Drosophila pseudotakahashii]